MDGKIWQNTLYVMEVDVELYVLSCMVYFGVGVLVFIYWLIFDKSGDALKDKQQVNSIWDCIECCFVFMFLWPVALFSGLKKWLTKSREFPWHKEY